MNEFYRAACKRQEQRILDFLNKSSINSKKFKVKLYSFLSVIVNYMKTYVDMLLLTVN